MDLRPSFESMQGAFGLPATVTLSGEDPIATTAVWLPPATEEVPTGNDIRRAEARRTLCIARVDVPQVPRGTIVVCAEEYGGDAVRWMVDGTERVDTDHRRVLVVLAPEEGS